MNQHENHLKFKPNQEGLYESRDNDFENSEYLSNLPGENGEGVFDGVDVEVVLAAVFDIEWSSEIGSFLLILLRFTEFIKVTELNLKKYGYDAGISKLISLGRF